jgi:hypothetical protein
VGALRSLGISLSALCVVWGCGSGRPPPGQQATIAPDPGSLGGGDDAPKLPGCGQQDSGAFCDCVDAPLFTDPPNMYFVLDRSGSMIESNKFGLVRVTVANVLKEVASRANFGVELFPGGDGTNCGVPADELIKLTPGDPPSKNGGNLYSAFINSTAGIVPNGATPTAGALAFAQARLAKATGKSFVILATDGGPNCNPTANCGVGSCIPNIENMTGCDATVNCCAPPVGIPENCLDAQATIDAARSLNAAGIPVYVIGIPGSAPYANVLDQLAAAGGTAQPTSPRYFKVDSAGQAELQSALKHVAAKIVSTCTFKLKAPPQDENLVNVYFDEAILPKDPTGGNGWSISGDTLTLEGGACQNVLAGNVVDVRIIVGCPSVLH